MMYSVKVWKGKIKKGTDWRGTCHTESHKLPGNKDDAYRGA